MEESPFDISLYKTTGEILGKGQYGEVFLIRKIKKPEEVAAAKFIKNHENMSNYDQLMIEREISILKQINHRAILKFIGYTTQSIDDKNDTCRPTIVTEYLENGTLKCMIKKEKEGKNLPEGWNATRKKICLIGIADGMRYLHHHGIIHRDLKVENVLIDSDFFPRICDFGFSRWFPHSHIKFIDLSITPQIGTPLYMAPELIRGDNHYTNSVDIYSFGFLAYQVVTGELFNEVPDKFPLKVLNGSRPEIPNSIKPKMAKLISQCWDMDPSKRPSFDEICIELTNDYLNEYFDGDINKEDVESYIEGLKIDNMNDHCMDEKPVDIVKKDNAISELNKLNKCNMNIIKKLSEKCNLKKCIISDMPILKYCCSNGNYELAKYLIEDLKMKVEPIYLHVACRSGSIDLVNYLINTINMDPLSKDENGVSILHYACLSGNIDIIKYLLQTTNVDINAKTNDDRTVLHFACHSNNLELLQFLLSMPLENTNPKNAKNKTLLHIACASGNVEIVDYLINVKGMDVNEKDNDEMSSLHHACESGKLDLVYYLLKHPNSFNLKDEAKSKMTILHFACKSGNIYLVKYLLSCDDCPDITLITQNGMSVLHFACQSGSVKLVEYLISRKQFDIGLKNFEKQTPRDIAIKKKFFEIDKIFQNLNHK